MSLAHKRAQLYGAWYLALMLWVFSGPALLVLAEYGDATKALHLLDVSAGAIQVVIAFHLFASIAVGLLGYLGVRGRGVRSGVMVAILLAPSVAALILSRIGLGPLANQVLNTAMADRPEVIALGLVDSGTPLFAGLLSSACLAFALAAHLLLGHYAIDRKAVQGTFGWSMLPGWLIPLALAGTFAFFRIRHWPTPDPLEVIAWSLVVGFMLLSPFAIPVSRGLAKQGNERFALEALDRVASLGWVLPLMVVLLGQAQIWHRLADGLAQAAAVHAAQPMQQAAQEVVTGGHWWWGEIGLALIAAIPLLLAGGAGNVLFAPKRWDRRSMVSVVVLILAVAWFAHGRRVTLALVHEPGAEMSMLEGVDVPNGEGNAELGSGSRLRLTDEGHIEWERSVGERSSFPAEAKSLVSAPNVLVLASRRQSFSHLVPALTALAPKHVAFRLIELRTEHPQITPSPDKMVALFQPSTSKLVGDPFRFVPEVDLESLDTLNPEDPPGSVLLVTITNQSTQLTDLPGRSKVWTLPQPGEHSETSEAIHGRLDLSPWVVIAFDPEVSSEKIGDAIDTLSEGHLPEVILTPNPKAYARYFEPPSE